jgi:glyoxylase-like metal-dependent hydrolase (beta-lactamase superfamily II)
MLTGRGGNIGLTVGADGAAIIDDQFDDMAPKIRAAVSMLSASPVKFVINTHLHGDHTGGNDAFGKAGLMLARRVATDGKPAITHHRVGWTG